MTNKPTILNVTGLTRDQRDLFYTLVNNGMLEWNAYTTSLMIDNRISRRTMQIESDYEVMAIAKEARAKENRIKVVAKQHYLIGINHKLI